MGLGEMRIGEMRLGKMRRHRKTSERGLEGRKKSITCMQS